MSASQQRSPLLILKVVKGNTNLSPSRGTVRAEPGADGVHAAARFLFEATPDMRKQLHRMDTTHPVERTPGIDAIFLTHAHIGHYCGLMFLGHESLGSKSIPVHTMPRMAEFLTTNGPWSQLVKYNNISLQVMKEGQDIVLNPRLKVTPLLVPHRQEYSEVSRSRLLGALHIAI